MTSFVCKATAPTEIYTSRTTLPLHDALPICPLAATFSQRIPPLQAVFGAATPLSGDRPYASADRSKDTQIAGFGQIDWRATEQLTLTLGGRVARTKFYLDRKSVVQGKSVSVRVDLGGRRTLKKKRTKKEQDQHS